MKCFAGYALAIVVLSGSLAAAQGGAVAGTAQAAPPPQPPMTNLQLIPKDTPRAQVIATMQGITAALSVQCNYCHV